MRTCHSSAMRVHIGTDHAGFELKNFLVAELTKDGHEVIDHGPQAYDAEDDYPAFCIATGEAMVADPGSLAIVIGGSGNGEQIAANKVTGTRAALAYDVDTARLAREHNDANVISLGARMHSEEEALAWSSCSWTPRSAGRNDTYAGSGCWRSTRTRAANPSAGGPRGSSPCIAQRFWRGSKGLPRAAYRGVRRPSTRASNSSMTSSAIRSSSASGRDTSRARMARSKVTSPEAPSRPNARPQLARLERVPRVLRSSAVRSRGATPGGNAPVMLTR